MLMRLASLTGRRAYLSGVAWNIIRGQYTSAYLALADPALLDVLEREEDDHTSPPGR